LTEKLAPIVPSSTVLERDGVFFGVGLHDSSAATIPYLQNFREPWVLISTGTWCITMNPFNDSPLTAAELEQDCLCYLSYTGRPVKASRLFAGYEHEEQVRRLADHFHLSPAVAADVRFDRDCAATLRERGRFQEPTDFKTFEQAYHALLMDIMDRQVRSTTLVLPDRSVKRLFVDGGFAKNEVYMQLLADAFPGVGVFAASVPQASALGAALVIHKEWNSGDIGDIIELKNYSPA
jgi:L-fuculokinase